MNVKKVKIGIVNINSGELLITDPENLKNKLFNFQTHIVKGLLFWGKYQTEVYKVLKDLKFNIRKYNNKYLIVGSAKKAERKIKELKTINNWKVACSLWYNNDFDKMSQVIYNSLGGNINYPTNHPGMGVAILPGKGNGKYSVEATITNDPQYGERITKIEMNFMEEET